jgi:hypothetical protein
MDVLDATLRTAFLLLVFMPMLASVDAESR